MKNENMKNLSIIVCTSNNFVIGCNNKIPWHLSSDLKRFKNITSDHTVVMGRNTYESIGKLLKNRRNIILTRNLEYKVEGCEIVHSKEELYDIIDDYSEVFIIGGEEIYRMFYNEVNTIYLSKLLEDFKGDSFFPVVNINNWKIEESFLVNDEYNYIFYKLIRIL